MKLAILTRSAASISEFISILSKKNVEVILIIEFPKPVKLNKKKYSAIKRLDINLYRVVRKVLFSPKVDLHTTIEKIEKIDGSQIAKLLMDNNVDTLLLKNAPIIKERELTKLKNFTIINAHSGLLPYYKGASCGFWPIVENKNKLGVTLHYVTAQLDKGNIINKKQIPLSKISFSFKFPVRVNQLQIEELANCVYEFTVDETLVYDKKSDEINENSGYYSLPTLTSYIRGVWNLYKK